MGTTLDAVVVNGPRSALDLLSLGRDDLVAAGRVGELVLCSEPTAAEITVDVPVR
jgi:hypothetical protein